MSLRTVVVCPDCRATFIVQDIPQSTTCRRCRKRHQFKKLKQYFQTENKGAARKVRTAVQAHVDDLSDEFERAQEAGVLEDIVDEIIDEDEYLSEMGADTEDVSAAEERALRNQNRQKSKKDIVFDAVREQDSPTRDDVRAYAKQFGMDGDDALAMLDKWREAGRISGNWDGPFRLH
jgi:NMD protein affecting ribosome stability and mRNA decay